MLKGLFIGIVTLFTFNTSNTEKELISPDDTVCRVTCTINVPNPVGPGTIGISGTAGNFLTSCETAREKACKRAAQNALDILM